MKPHWKHQVEGIERGSNQKNFALFFEMGCGKSRTAIGILQSKFTARKDMASTIIFCPPIVIKNWQDEWLKFSQIPRDRLIMLTGAGKQRLLAFQKSRERLFDKSTPLIFITNYESLLMPDLLAGFRALEPAYIIFDESHQLKNSTARRSKLAEQLTEGTRNKRPDVLLLSGTPVLNSPLDLFQQMKVMDGGDTLGTNYFVFRKKYFADRNAHMPSHMHFPKWELRTLAKDGLDGVAEINKLIQPVSMRVLKKDCLDLPPLIRQTVKVGMSIQQKRLYESMAKDFVAYVTEDQACTATLAITKALRLLQIASCFVKTEQGQEIPLTHTPKLIALKELLQELTPSGKVLIWAVFQENYKAIKEVLNELELGFVEVTGASNPADRQQSVDTFNSDPNCSVFLGNPGSGGIGINLVVAPYSIFFSRNFSLAADLQARARNHRGGSEIHERITQYDLVCENTIDELVSEALSRKEAIGEETVKSMAKILREQLE